MRNTLIATRGLLARDIARLETRTLWFTIARTVIALAEIATLALTETDALFQSILGQGAGPVCGGVASLSLFCTLGALVGDDASRWIAAALLLLVATGYRPRYLGVVHYWVAFSLGVSLSLPDGGEQVARITVFMLMLISLGDNRRWGWRSAKAEFSPNFQGVAFAAVWALRIQMAIVYLQSGIAKLYVDDWINGSAQYYFIRASTFGATGPLFDLLEPLTRNPVIVAGMTWGAIIVEIAIGVLVVRGIRSRTVALAASVVLHIAIWATLGIFSFSLIMIGSMVAACAPSSSREESWLVAKLRPGR